MTAITEKYKFKVVEYSPLWQHTSTMISIKFVDPARQRKQDTLMDKIWYVCVICSLSVSVLIS